MPGSTPRLRFAAFGLSMDTLWTRALQRAVRLAAYCSNFHPCGVRFALAPPPDRELSPSRHIAAVRPSPPQNGKYATARARKSLAPAHEPAGPSRAARAASAPWSQFPQTRRSARPFHAPRKNSVGSSRPRSPAFAGLVLAGRKGTCQSPPSVRAQNSAPTAVGACHAPCFIGPPAPQKSAAGGPDQRCFPPSVSPLWNPPFLIPPSNSNTPKGGNRRGQQRGVSTGAAEETAGPLSPRGAAPRRPSG